jgi:hypothetical protein
MGLPEPVLALAFTEGGGNLLYNAVDGSVSTLTAVGTGNVAEWQGDGFYLEDGGHGTNGNWFSVPPAPFQGIGTGNYTLAAGGRLDSSKPATIFCFDSYDPQWGFYNITGKLHVYDGIDLFSGGTAVLNTDFDVAYVREGTGAGLLKGYVSGFLDVTGTHSAALPDPAVVRLGWDNYGDEFFCGLVRYVYFWRVALTPAQVARVAAEPYGIFTPARRPAIWLVPAPVNFSGTAAGQTATAAAALNVSRPLAGTAAGQTAASVAEMHLAGPINLSGTAAAVTQTEDAILSVARALSGTSSGQSATTAAVLSILHALSGTSSGQSATTAAVLGILRALSGTSSGQSATSAASLVGSMYPSFPQKIGSKATTQSGIRIDTASNGNPLAQILYSSDRKTFYINHTLDSTDKATLDTFYATNKALEFTFTWAGDGQDYNCIFMDAPQFVPRGASRYEVSVMMIQKDT